MKGDRETLRIEEQPGDLLLVTLDRPEVSNAFNTGAALELCELFERFQGEQPYRCVVLTGAGDKAFCAGADLKERTSLSDEQWHSQHEVFERMFRAVRDCPIPLTAAITGMGQSRTARNMRSNTSCCERHCSSVSELRSFRSAPAQKALSPAPVTTTHRYRCSAWKRSKSSHSLSAAPVLKALETSGR